MEFRYWLFSCFNTVTFLILVQSKNVIGIISRDLSGLSQTSIGILDFFTKFVFKNTKNLKTYNKCRIDNSINDGFS